MHIEPSAPIATVCPLPLVGLECSSFELFKVFERIFRGFEVFGLSADEQRKRETERDRKREREREKETGEREKERERDKEIGRE